MASRLVSCGRIVSAASIPLATLRRLVGPPAEPALADAGRDGELLIARARLGLALLFVLSPIATLVRHPRETPAWLSLAVGWLFVVTGLATTRLARRHWRQGLASPFTGSARRATRRT